MNPDTANKKSASRRRSYPKPTPKRKVGRPTKATPELLEAILADMALGLTEEEACALSGIDDATFYRWKQRPEFRNLRARAAAVRIKERLAKKDAAAAAGNSCWKSYAWDLEKVYRNRFGEDKLTLNAQQNNFMITREEAREIDAQVERIMPEVDKLLEEHALDEIEGPAVYDHPPSQAPREHEHLESAREQVAPHSIKANDTGSLNGVEKSPKPEPEPVVPLEPEPVRWRDRKPLPGPLSARQLRLEQERSMGRADGDGKMPF